MKFVIASLTYFYSNLLLLYPGSFRNEFAEEMKVVFRDSVNEAVKNGTLSLVLVCLREMSGLPFNILREFWHEFQRKETRMLHEHILHSPEKSVTAGQVIMGSLPFLVFGLFLILLEIPVAWSLPAWFDTVAGIIFAFLLILPAIGFGVGWVQKFPRWSYPYAGMAFVMALYIASVTTPGLKILGYPIFGRELWGWRAWIPLGMAFVVALAISRSFQPVLKLFTNLWEDWSILSYLMMGFLPLLIAIEFDEIDRLYSLYFMVPFAVLLVGVAVFYLLGHRTWQRVLTLTVGIVIIIVATAIGSTSYWLDHSGTSLANAMGVPGRAMVIILIMLLPAWLELLRRSVSRLRTT
ncbi:MAG: hypothetical protein ACXW4E_07015 [Anaerolineales bacterium]